MRDEALASIGRYIVRSRLGKGGMGMVYLALDPLLDRLVAIKLFHDLDSDDQLRQRFHREARTAARLNHPNIVTIFDIGEDNGRPYIAMEYVAGETLESLIRRGGPLAVQRSLEIVDAVAAGLQFAHREGLVHRDIKPANVMVSREGEVKILDFGIARLVSGGSLTRAGMLIGSPSYMSPEQLRGAAVDHRSDIFSLGTTLYELLTGRKAFEGDVTTALVRILHEDPPRVSDVVPGLPPQIDAIVQRALEKDPERRYGELAAMRRDVAAVRTALAVDEEPRPAVRSAVSIAGDRSDERQGPQDDGAAIVPPGDAPAVDLPRRSDEERRQHARLVLQKAREYLDAGEDEQAAVAMRAIDCDDATVAAEAASLNAAISVSAAERERRVDLENRTARALAEATRASAAGETEAALGAVHEALAYVPEHPGALALKRELEARRASAGRAGVETPPARSAEQSSTEIQHAPTVNIPAPQVQPERQESRANEPGTVIFQAPGDAANQGQELQVQARLVVTKAADPRLLNKSFDLGNGEFVIGRAAEAQLQSTDLSWSRQHAAIEYRDGGFFIHDLGSANGIFVDGRLVKGRESAPLFFGAQITIGATMLKFAPVRDITLPDLTGSEMAGRYVLETLLRESTQGALYAARLKTLPTRRAIKLLSPHLLRYPGYKDRFRHRAEVTSQLHHPHICRVNEYGETRILASDGTPVDTVYLCLDLMMGGSLADRLNGGGHIPIQRIDRWVQLVSDALAHAHDANVLHGDLKPTAVVFDNTEAENPYVTDFALQRDRPVHVLVGTPEYMAPEQWDAAGIGPHTDQFGLALLAYHMIAGVPAFVGQDHPEIRRRNFALGPLPAHEEAERRGRKDVNARVSAVLARGLAVKPDARYPTVKDFAEDFSRALRGSGAERSADQPPRVFLSYQRGPAAGWAVHIASQLREKHGIDVFLDVERVDAAVRFPDRLTRAIDSADVFVCLVGPTTLESAWVREEVRLAHAQGKPMIPIFQEDYIIPGANQIPEPPLQALFSYDGVRLLDLQNLYVDYAVLELAKRIKNTVTHGSSR